MNPAYLDESGTSYLHEPVFPNEERVGLYTVSATEEITQLRNKIAGSYVSHISAKIESIAAFAAGQDVNLLVLPEYSIPSETLETVKALSEKMHIVIVAGSHIATHHSMKDYQKVGLATGEESIGRAICPIFIPGSTPQFCQKQQRSKWESSLIPGSPCGPIPVALGTQKVNLQVSICLDAISESGPPASRARKKSVPAFMAMPSLSPKVDLFYDKARLLLAAGEATVFVNASEFGGSRAFATTEYTSSWRIDRDGSEPLPKLSEALVIMDLDLSAQYEVRGSTAGHFPVRSIDTYPLLYENTSAHAREYVELLDELNHKLPSSISDLAAKVSRFTAVEERSFPLLLQDKIKHFLTNVAERGLATDDAWRRWLNPVVIRSTTSTDILRWELCGEALELIHQLTMSGDHPDISDQLSAVHRYLVNRRKDLGRRIVPSQSRAVAGAPLTKGSGLEGVVTSFEPPFYNRETAFDGIRKFFESSAMTSLVLVGMRGIGKSSLAREVFRKVIPPTWKNVSVSLTGGMAYPRLLVEMAYKCGIRMPKDVLESLAAQVAVAQDLVLFFSQTARVVLVLDDLQYLLDLNGEMPDRGISSLLEKVIHRAATQRNKVLLITTNAPKFGPAIQAKTEVLHIKGLDEKNAEILLSFWFHFEREDLRGQAVEFPEQLFNLLNGHPLGIRVAAKMWAENPLNEVDLTFFKRLRETVVAYILDRVTLTQREEGFIRFASVFRLPVRREVFVRWRGDEAAFLIDSMAGRSFLETDADKYQLHPIIREYYYNSTPAPVLQPFHRIAGDYFFDLYSKSKSTSPDPDPEMLGEAIHHFIAAGERDKVKSFSLYKYEIRPVALSHYHKFDYDLAFKDYSLLLTLDPNDAEAHFHLALIYARRHKWDHAEEHFGKAISINPKAYWVYQGYGHAKLAAGQVAEAEHLLRQALGIKPTHSPALVDMGNLYERQGDSVEAEDFLRRAIDADENNAFAYRAYAKFLLDQGRYDEGLDAAMSAVGLNPRDTRNRDLVKELRRRIDAAKEIVNATGPEIKAQSVADTKKQ